MAESVMDEIARYNQEIRRAGALLAPLAPALATIDLDLLQAGLSHVQAVGPLVAPSQWMLGGSTNLEDQAAFIQALAPLVRYTRAGFRRAAETFEERLRREGKDLDDPRNFGVPHPDEEDGEP